MLASKYHLKGKKNFEMILSKGKFVQSESFGIAFLPSEDKAISSFGFIVSTKISKHAVLRNRVRRAMSEAVRFLMDKVKPGYNAVFLAKGQSLKKSTDELMREVEIALGKTGIFKS